MISPGWLALSKRTRYAWKRRCDRQGALGKPNLKVTVFRSQGSGNRVRLKGETPDVRRRLSFTFAARRRSVPAKMGSMDHMPEGHLRGSNKLVVAAIVGYWESKSCLPGVGSVLEGEEGIRRDLPPGESSFP